VTGLLGLRPYQLHPARAILDSIRARAGRSFVVIMSRQSGKNELSAQLETFLLTAGPSLDIGPIHNIKLAPTYTPQARISRDRLRHELRAARVPHKLEGQTITVGDASQTFLSAEPAANISGHTATPLLEVDEAQDVNIDKYDREVAPFAAANNATRVFYGTAWSEDDLLHRERTAAADAETRDGIRRLFLYDWQVLAAIQPAYKSYVLSERERLGPTHPMFQTQYELIPLAAADRLLNPTQLRQLAGDFPPLTARPTGAPAIAAGLDIGGAAGVSLDHDRTVLTIATVTPPTPADPLPDNHVAIVAQLSWTDVPHDVLIPTLIDIVTNVWRADTIAIDATGIGATTAQLLDRRTPRATVIPFVFTQPSKSQLGYDLQASASTGRLKLHAPDGSPDSIDTWHQLTRARADYLPSQAMRWYVPEAEGHDDHLVSVALCNHAARETQLRIARGR